MNPERLAAIDWALKAEDESGNWYRIAKDLRDALAAVLAENTRLAQGAEGHVARDAGLKRRAGSARQPDNRPRKVRHPSPLLPADPPTDVATSIA